MAALSEPGYTESIRANLFSYWHECCASGSPLAIFLCEHPQDANFNLADLAVGTLTFETSMIGGQRKIPVHGHQFEIVRVRSHSRRGMRGALRGNHLRFGLNLAFR